MSKFLWASCILVVILHFAHSQTELEGLQAVTNGVDGFTSDLYEVLRQSSQNLVASPISASASLAMLLAGAGGDTRDNIRTALKFPKTTPDNHVYNGYRLLLQQLQSDDKTTLDMVNGVFPVEGYPLQYNFTSTLITYFGAEPQQVNFRKNSVAAAERINSFVGRATNNKIQNLVSSTDIDKSTRLVLVNAIYFKAMWSDPFASGFTRKQDFYITPSRTVQVDMMKHHRSLTLPYAYVDELDSQVVQIPYKGNRMSMIVVLPNQRSGLAEVESKLRSFSLQRLVSALQWDSVYLSLPKFRIESSIDLKQPLTRVGAGIMFHKDLANFSFILDQTEEDKEPLFVAKAVQKTFLEVTEAGTEAAAATSLISAVPLSGSLRNPKSVVVDHPFHLIITAKVNVEGREEQVPLFVARVVNPTA